MDTKWKRCKFAVSLTAFCLGFSMLITFLAVCLTRNSQLPADVKLVMEEDYQNTETFRSYISDCLENFLGMATAGPVSWNSYSYLDYRSYGNRYYDTSYGTASGASASEGTTWVYEDETITAAARQETVTEQETAMAGENSAGYQNYYFGGASTPEQEAYNREQADWLHQKMKDDKNLLYLVQYEGETLYTNAEGSQLAGGSSLVCPEGYNFMLVFDGEKVRISKDGQELDIYGDGYYRGDGYYKERDGQWFVPGYQNFKVDEKTAGAYVVLAVQADPSLYMKEDTSTLGYQAAENTLYWMRQNHQTLKAQTVRLLAGGGVAAGLLVLAWLLRKTRKGGMKGVLRATAKIWMEAKVVIVLLTGALAFAFHNDLLYELISLFTFGFYPANIYYYMVMQAPALPLLSGFLFFGAVYLLACDLRGNSRPWKNSLVGKLLGVLNTRKLSMPVQKQMVRQYAVLLGVQVIFLAFLLAFIANWYNGVYYYYQVSALLIAMLVFWLLGTAYLIACAVRGRKTAMDLGALSAQIGRMQKGSLNEPVTVSAGSPLRQTAESLNEIQQGLNTALEEQMKSERMKVELVSNVSHDIKTPLTSIISYVDLLNQEEELPEHIRDYVRILDSKSQRLKAMVQDVFEISKAASGQLPVALEPIDLGKLLRQTLADMGESIQNSPVTVKSLISEAPVMILADGQRLYRVFQNLIQNALQYSLEGSRVYLNLTLRQQAAIVIIKNTSRAELRRDIDFAARFTRGDDSRTDGGSGLGLSIAQSFTEACGGRFSIHTDADLFTVTVEFPLLSEDGKAEN